jgi:LCP family protein required for cell wall assembly
MEQQDLINAVNKIRASTALKAKAISGEPAPRRKNPAYTPLFKGAACLAAVAVIALGVLVIPKILKPVVTVAPAAQSNSAESTANELYRDSKVQNILVLGIDQGADSSAARSDSILMVSIDNRHGKLKVTSFLRDMYVMIDGFEDNRLNTAYAFGGAPLAVKTIEKNFGIGIDKYVTVNYSAFEKIIDRMGGVTIDIKELEAKLINQNSGESADKSIAAGNVLLTGKQALYYCRIRTIDSDIVRTERQRKVAASIVNKLKTLEFDATASILNDAFSVLITNSSGTTNIKQDEMVGLIKDSLNFFRYPVSQIRVPADDTYKCENVRAMSVLVPDVYANKKILAKFLYEESFESVIKSNKESLASEVIIDAAHKTEYNAN